MSPPHDTYLQAQLRQHHVGLKRSKLDPRQLVSLHESSAERHRIRQQLRWNCPQQVFGNIELLEQAEVVECVVADGCDRVASKRQTNWWLVVVVCVWGGGGGQSIEYCPSRTQPMCGTER
jgi:hypothetical protein